MQRDTRLAHPMAACSQPEGSTSTVPRPWLEQMRPGGIIQMNVSGQMGAGAFLKIVQPEPGLAWLLMDTFLLVLSLWNCIRQGSILRGQCSPGNSLHAPRLMPLYYGIVAWISRSHWLFLRCPLLRSLCIPCVLACRQVEVRGDLQTWEQVLTTYHQWRELGRPDMSAHHLPINAQDKQAMTPTLSLERRHGICPPGFLLSRSNPVIHITLSVRF